MNMNRAYREMMQQQCLSADAQRAFFEKAQAPQHRRKAPTIVKIAAVAACLCLLIPLGAYAVERIFGYSIVEIFENSTPFDTPGTGYQVEHPDTFSRPLSDFSEEIREVDRFMLKAYDSWAEAEDALGIKLVENTFLSGENVQKIAAYDLRHDGLSGRQHCFTYYHGKSGQFYRAMLTAVYRYQDAQITLHSTVTAEHPEISEEDARRLHQTAVGYENADVQDITREAYTAANGIQTDIVRVEWTSGHAPEYAACFSANGASYKITVTARDPQADAESRALLIEVLEAFVF